MLSMAMEHPITTTSSLLAMESMYRLTATFLGDMEYFLSV